MKYAVFEVDTCKSEPGTASNFPEKIRDLSKDMEVHSSPTKYCFLVSLSERTQFLGELIQAAKLTQCVYRVHYFQADSVTFESTPDAAKDL